MDAAPEISKNTPIRLTLEDKAEAIRRLRDGQSVGDIAAALGLRPNIVGVIRKRWQESQNRLSGVEPAAAPKKRGPKGPRGSKTNPWPAPDVKAESDLDSLRLEIEVARLKAENEILWRAVDYFRLAKKNGPGPREVGGE